MKKNSVLPIVLVTSLFFLWGLTSNLLPTLIPHLKKACRLTDFQSAFIDSAYWIGYFCIAIPAGLVMKKFGYKKAIIAGLLIAAIGTFLFYPAANARTFAFFLFALFIIASGMTFLETAANPYMTILGPPETSSLRLNLAQAFNGLGAFIAGRYLSKVILSGKEITDDFLKSLAPADADALLTKEAQSVQAPYVIIGLVLLSVAILFILTKFPPENTSAETTSPSAGEKTSQINAGSGASIFSNRQVLLGVVAQFFYVGGQVCISSFFIRYSKYAAGMQESQSTDYLGYMLLGFMTGRYIGTFLMRYIQPAVLLAVYSFANIVLLGIIISAGGKVSIFALIGVEFFMSIMFPTIFSLTLKGLGDKTKLASSLLVMAIVGGAVFPVLMGRISDAANIQQAYIVPAVCFVVILFFAFRIRSIHTKEDKALLAGASV